MILEKKIDSDLSDRQEERFFIPLSFTGLFLQGINRILKVKRFSDREVAETIYFNNLAHEVPWGTSLKIRHYKRNLSCSGRKIRLSNDQRYLLEVKKESDKGSYSRRKERKEVPLEEVIDLVNSQGDFINPLHPYVGTEYLRCHYVPFSDLPIRVTVDTSVSYWFFSSSEIGLFLGSEPYLRVEVKSHYSVLDSEAYRSISDLLNSCHAKPIISKKYMAYNLLCRYRTKLGQKFSKELREHEIEAKLLLEAKDVSYIFRELQQIFGDKKGRFRTEEIFPYSFESASINEYFCYERGRKKEEALKFLFKGGWFKTIYKEGLEIVDNSLGLSCITKRREVKFSPYQIFSPSSYLDLREKRQSQLKRDIFFLGNLMRLRKAFWVESTETGRLYHLSVDQCTHGDNRMYQLEIEYSASPKLSKESDPENSIIEDIAFIAEQIKSSFSSAVKPTALTKFQWLEKLV